MGCKQHLACYNKYIFNFDRKVETNGTISWVDPDVPSQVDQCLSGREESVCRQCCDPNDDPDGKNCGMLIHLFLKFSFNFTVQTVKLSRSRNEFVNFFKNKLFLGNVL